MTQHAMTLVNQSGAALRADLNNALAALASSSNGSTAPAITFATQPWADTSSDTMKIRNAANTAWVSVWTLSTGVALGTVANATNATNATNAQHATVDAIVSGALTSSSPSAGVGYATGAGSSVTQTTNILTGVTINKLCGQITTVTATYNASGASNAFTVSNSTVGLHDTVVASVQSTSAGGNTYLAAEVTSVGAGGFTIRLFNPEAVSGLTLVNVSAIINFSVLKAVNA